MIEVLQMVILGKKVRCNINAFTKYLTKAIQSILKNKVDLNNNKDLNRSHLKRHVQLLVYSQLDDIVKKLIP